MSTLGKDNVDDGDFGKTSEYITVFINKQLFGIPVLNVQDVFMPQKVTRVPSSQPEVGGVLNLRGRIVTIIDMRERLGIAAREENENSQTMAVGVEFRGESYGLVIDAVGEVLRLKDSSLERNPANLDPRWRGVSSGVQRLEDALMVILDVPRVLDFTKKASAA